MECKGDLQTSRMAFTCEFSTEGMLAANTLSTQTQQKMFTFFNIIQNIS